MRTVKKLNDEMEFIDCKFRDLKKGDIFRLFEPDGTPVTDFECLAAGDPYTIDGVLGIDVEIADSAAE